MIPICQPNKSSYPTSAQPNKSSQVSAPRATSSIRARAMRKTPISNSFIAFGRTTTFNTILIFVTTVFKHGLQNYFTCLSEQIFYLSKSSLVLVCTTCSIMQASPFTSAPTLNPISLSQNIKCWPAIFTSCVWVWVGYFITFEWIACWLSGLCVVYPIYIKKWRMSTLLSTF